MARWARRGVATVAGVAIAAGLMMSAASPSNPPSPEPEPQATTQAAQWTGGLAGDAPCPEGSTRSATLLHEPLEGGIPHAQFADGWSSISGGVSGKAARSSIGGSGENWFFTSWGQAPVGAHTMFAFTSRGNISSSSYSRADVNSISIRAQANNGSWQGRVYDVTAATQDEGGRLGPWFQHRAQSGTSSWWEVDNVQLYTCRSAPVSRLSGPDRYSTSGTIAAQFPTRPDVVYLASGENFADALAGSARAASQDTPVLLVRPDRIPGATAAQLERLDPAGIVVLGGSGAVNDTVVQQAQAYTDGTVTRLAGANRWETSAQIADTYPVGPETVYIASGADFPDALAGGATAGRLGVPLLLTDPEALPSAIVGALERLEPGRIVILGGPGAVSDDVRSELRDYTTGGVTRIAGKDRYETSAHLAHSAPTSPDRVFLATGGTFPDALSGSALAGMEGTAVLLTRDTAIPRPVRNGLDRLSGDSGVVLGGYTSVHSIVLDQLGRYVG